MKQSKYLFMSHILLFYFCFGTKLCLIYSLELYILELRCTRVLQVIKSLRKTVKLKAKNLDGKTALDILQTHQSPCFPKGRRLLNSVKERLFSGSTLTLAEYLRKNLTFMEKRNKFLGTSNLSSTPERSPKTSKRNDAILVVAVLIVTATYQVGLSPPGGVWQENSSSNPTAHNVHHAGEMTIDKCRRHRVDFPASCFCS